MAPPSFTHKELEAQMTPVGVNRVVLIQMSFYGYDNSYMLDVIQKFPERYRGVGIIDQDGKRSDIEMRKMKGLGVRGFRIVVKNQPESEWLTSVTMQQMWQTGAEEQLAMCCLIEPGALHEIDRMCRLFPKTPVVIDHLCRIGVSGKIDQKDVKLLCSLARHENVYVKVSAFYALGKKQAPYTDLAPLIQQVVEAYGAKRLMWATDCPYQVQEKHTYKASIDLIKNGLPFLSKEDKTWLLQKTAEKVFFS